MNVNSAPPVQDPGVLVQVLKSGRDAQVDMVEKLISVNVTAQIDAQKMAIAAQIIDVYA